MPSSKDINVKDEPGKYLFVGENGTGKTIAAASFYKAGPIRFHEFDGRMKPVKSFFPEADINYDDFGTDNFRRFVDEIEELEKECRWKTVVLDSVTTASTTCVVFQLKVKDKLKTTKAGLPATSWDEINGETVLFTQLLESLKVIHKKHGVNIIWTAHPVPKMEIASEGEAAKRVTSLAAYGNKIPALIPGYFDEIYNFQKEKMEMSGPFNHVAYTVPKNTLPGKTAFSGMPERINFTGKNFYELLMEKIK